MTALALDDCRSFARAFEAFRPSPRERLIDWCLDHLVNEFGRPYDAAAYPWQGAPGGPFDALDDDRVREIVLQWATRLGKTLIGEAPIVRAAHRDPAPAMLASSTEKLARQVVNRTYAMVRSKRHLADLLIRPEREQRYDLVEFRGMNVHVAWSRSPSRLGDITAVLGHANEIDKWEHATTATEAHPLELFGDRFKDVASIRKVVYESTPTVAGRSQVERRRLSGTDCRYAVPCPACHEYQPLEFGDADLDHGVKWTGSGEQAVQSARYVCRHCGILIGDDRRKWMMLRGVWFPSGTTVDSARALERVEAELAARSDVHELQAALVRGAEAVVALPSGDEVAYDEIPAAINDVRERFNWPGWSRADWIDGDPVRDGGVASYQLSSLYATSLSWGDLVRQFLRTKDSPQLLRNWVNQWRGDTWELVTRRATWEELVAKLSGEERRGVVPPWARLLTAGIDKQADRYVWVLRSWGPQMRSHGLAYGETDDVQELFDEILSREWPRIEDRGSRIDEDDSALRTPHSALQVTLGLVDARYKPADVYRLVQQAKDAGIRLYPCMGSNRPLGTYYLRKKLSDKSPHAGQRYVSVDTNSTQDWLDQALHVVGRNDPSAWTVYADPDPETHRDYVEQLLNEAAVAGTDARNEATEVWQRLDENYPNDYRDAERYAFVAMLVATGGQPLRGKRPRRRGPRVRSLRIPRPGRER